MWATTPIVSHYDDDDDNNDDDDDDDDEGSDRRSRMPTSISLWVTCSHKTSALQ